MNQSARQTCILWSIAAIVLATTFGLGNSSSSQPHSASKISAASSQTYPGPSDDYAATPHPWSLTYSGPGGFHYSRDPDRQGRRADGFTEND